MLFNNNICFAKRANKRLSSESLHCTKNLIYTESQSKYGAKKYKLQLNQGQRWLTPHLLSNLQPHVNWDANAVFTIFAFDFLLVCTSCSRYNPSVVSIISQVVSVRFSSYDLFVSFFHEKDFCSGS